jgi:hypothetical protein
VYCIGDFPQAQEITKTVTQGLVKSVRGHFQFSQTPADVTDDAVKFAVEVSSRPSSSMEI